MPIAVASRRELPPSRPRRRRLRLLRTDGGRAGRHPARQAGAGHRPARPHRRQRLLRARAGDRHRDPRLRRAPVPHLERAGLELREPVHRVHELPAPGLHHLQRARPTRCRSTWPRSASTSARASRPDEARALVAEQAGEIDTAEAANLEEKADLADRPPALRGVHPRLHEEAVADRPHRAARRRHRPAAGALHVRQPLLQRHLRGSAGRRLHRVADQDGRPPEHRGAAVHRLLRRPRRAAGRRPDGVHRADRQVLRLRGRRAGLADAGLRDRRCCRSATSRAPR